MPLFHDLIPTCSYRSICFETSGIVAPQYWEKFLLHLTFWILKRLHMRQLLFSKVAGSKPLSLYRGKRLHPHLTYSGTVQTLHPASRSIHGSLSELVTTVFFRPIPQQSECLDLIAPELRFFQWIKFRYKNYLFFPQLLWLLFAEHRRGRPGTA